MEFALGGFRIMDETHPVEIGTTDLHGSGKVRCSDASDGEDDSGRVAIHFEGSSAPERKAPVGGEPKQGRPVRPPARGDVDDPGCGDGFRIRCHGGKRGLDPGGFDGGSR